MPTKKITKKPVTKVAKKTNGISIFKWFFTPDMKQGTKSWIARSLLFVVGLLFLTLLFGTVSMMSEMAKDGMGDAGFFAVAKQLVMLVYFSFRMDPLFYITALLMLFALGIFLFMPRRYLDRTSFVAAFFTSTAWAIITAIASYIGIKSHISQYIVLSIMSIFILSISGIIASIVCFARKIGTSKLLTLLVFPFCATLFEFIGYFIPTKNNDNVINIKYNWYKKLIAFLLDTKKGQISLFVAVLLISAISPTPWELFIITFLGSLYILRGKEWMANNIKIMTAVSATVNVILILGILLSIMIGK